MLLLPTHDHPHTLIPPHGSSLTTTPPPSPHHSPRRAYIGYVMFSTSAPGLPVWQTPPESLVAVLHESLNYFYINIALSPVRRPSP